MALHVCAPPRLKIDTDTKNGPYLENSRVTVRVRTMPTYHPLYARIAPTRHLRLNQTKNGNKQLNKKIEYYEKSLGSSIVIQSDHSPSRLARMRHRPSNITTWRNLHIELVEILKTVVLSNL